MKLLLLFLAAVLAVGFFFSLPTCLNLWTYLSIYIKSNILYNINNNFFQTLFYSESNHNNNGVQFIVFGDWGTGDQNQWKVAKSITEKIYRNENNNNDDYKFVLSTGTNYFVFNCENISRNKCNNNLVFQQFS